MTLSLTGHQVRTALSAGFVAGTLDIVFAILVSAGSGPLTALHAIASAVMGRAAYAGGLATAALGLALHFAIAMVVAAIFVAVATRRPVMVRRPLLSGSALGSIVFIVMYGAVVPLSAIVFPPLGPVQIAMAVFGNIALFGVPIALVTARMMNRRSGRSGRTF